MILLPTLVLASLVAIGALLPFVFLAELVARASIRRWGGYYRYRPHWRERHDIDVTALPQLLPFAKVEINRDGERGDEPPGPREGAFRALVVGGSAAECFLLDQPQTWAAVAQRELSRPENLRALGARRAHIGSVARAIVPCEHIELMLRKMLPRYPHLDVVIIMVGASDVVSWMEQGMPRTIPEGHLDASKVFEQHPEIPWGWTPRETALWRLAVILRRRLRHPVRIRADSGGWLHRVRKMRAAAPTHIDEVPDGTPMFEHFERHLAALIRTAQTGSRRVLVVRQPWMGAHPTPAEQALLWNFGLGRPYREEVTAYFTPRVIDALMESIDTRATTVADALGAENVDVRPALAGTTGSFYDYLHFTPQGAELVGRAVAAALLLPKK